MHRGRHLLASKLLEFSANEKSIFPFPGVVPFLSIFFLTDLTYKLQIEPKRLKFITGGGSLRGGVWGIQSVGASAVA